MKYFFLILSFLFSTPVLADSTFLSGLNFVQVYEQKGDSQYQTIGKNGISVALFLNKINSTETSLGEKVALLEAISSYYEWGDKQKGNFKMYQKAYYSYLTKQFNQKVSTSNKVFKPEIRLILQLMEDYDSTSPNVDAYQSLAEEMPKSLAFQSIAVIAFAYDILYNDKNDFASMQNLKLHVLAPYFKNLNSLDLDVPIEIKELGVDDLLPYTLDCEGRLKCLVDTSTEQAVANGLNELSKTIRENILSGTAISNSYSSDWVDTKKTAAEWISIEDKNIDKLNIPVIQKAEMKYFFSSQLYKLMHNIDYLTSRFLDSTLVIELNKSKAKCKMDAMCAANNYIIRVSTDLEKKGISQKNIEQLTSVKNTYKSEFENKSKNFGLFEAVGSADGEPVYNFENSFDTLHFLMLHYYANPEKITEMYNMN